MDGELDNNKEKKREETDLRDDVDGELRESVKESEAPNPQPEGDWPVLGQQTMANGKDDSAKKQDDDVVKPVDPDLKDEVKRGNDPTKKR